MQCIVFQVKRLLNKLEFILVPVANPDGYAVSDLVIIPYYSIEIGRMNGPPKSKYSSKLQVSVGQVQMWLPKIFH